MVIRFFGACCLFWSLVTFSTTSILTADIPRISPGIFLEKAEAQVLVVKEKVQEWVMYFIKPEDPWIKTKASWYGPGFHGKITACGDKYDQNELTAAHFDLPCGTPVKVENLENGLVIIIPITDRGPFDPASVEEYKHTGNRKKLKPFEGRGLDLSKGSMKAIGGTDLADIRYREVK